MSFYPSRGGLRARVPCPGDPRVVALGLLAVPLIVWLALTVSRSPWIALSLYAASVPFGSAVRVPGLAGGLGTLSSWLGMVATAALVLQLAGGWRRSPHLDPALPVWLMLLALTLLTYLWSVAPAETLHDVMVLAALVLLYAVAVMAPAGSVERVTLQRGLVAGGVMVGLLGFVDMATGAFAAGRAAASESPEAVVVGRQIPTSPLRR